MSGDYKYEKPLSTMMEEDARKEDERTDLEKAVEKAREETTDTSKEEEEDKLYTEAELEAFWISVINQDPFIERGSKRNLEYELRSMTDEQRREIEHYMDESTFKLAVHHEAQQARCNIAQTFIKFGKYSPSSKENLIIRLEKLGSVTVPVMDMMISIMAKFNQKLMQMTEAVNSPNF